jgi:crotonobetainyl-CoA:carnitine CoA-transferase CaiB-like acyl-CoA transferase
MVIQAYGGVAVNEADPKVGTPRFARQVLADKVTALTAAQAITAALFARERGHGGQHVRLSMLDAVVSFMWVDAAGNEVLRDGDGSQPGSVSVVRFNEDSGARLLVLNWKPRGTLRQLLD